MKLEITLAYEMILVGSSLGFMTSLATDGNIYNTRYEFSPAEQALSPIRYLLVTPKIAVSPWYFWIYLAVLL